MKSTQALIKQSHAFTNEDRLKSWTLLLSSLAIAFGLWAITFSSTVPLLLRVFCSLLLGGVWVRIFIISHDFQHGAIFRKSKPAKWILATFGVFILNPPRVWNRSHNYHHQHNAEIAMASIGSFPVMTVQQFRDAPEKAKAKYRLARNPLVVLFAYFTIFLMGMCLGSFLKDPKRHFDSGIALLLNFALTFFYITLGWDKLILSFLLPHMLATCAGAYLFYIQHNFPDIKLKPRKEWDYGFAALNSSSFLKASPITHWFTGNIGYHHVHHLNSLIPFYNLPKAMASMPELQNPGKTSLHPMEIARCFRLKLWDPDQNRMVGFEAV